MNPDQLSAKGTEHGIQAAFFCWCAMAERYGYTVADNMNAYSRLGLERTLLIIGERNLTPVPELEWIHAIPNGGKRDAASAAMLKAEGVKSGIADVFLPYQNPSNYGCALYIEFKTSVGKQSTEQKAFELYCNRTGYVYKVCRTWREAATVIKEYLG